ncbi:MAG: peptidylprolyl isomerase [Planctomycetota bacterium]|nr:MAG: peptidylprolyl isomerase [Planctomycetota bacterium]
MPHHSSLLAYVCLGLLLSLGSSPLFAAEGDTAVDEPNPRILISTSHGDIIAELFPDAAPQTVQIFLGLATGERAWRDPESGQMVRRPYYDGTIFHRVIPGFMIQGGDILGTGAGGAGFTFSDEMNAKGLGLDQEKVFQDGRLHPQMAYMEQQLMEQVIVPRLEAQGLGPHSPEETVNAAYRTLIQELIPTYTLKDFYQDLGYRYDEHLSARRPLRGALAMANRGPETNSGQFFINLTDTPHLTGKHTVFGQVVAGFEVVERIAAVERDARDRPREAVTIQSIRPIVDEQPAPDQP